MTAIVPGQDRHALVAAATAGWRRYLADLGGPNTLLWHDPQAGGLDLTTAHPGGVSKLLKGARTRLSEVVREAAAYADALATARALHARAEELLDEHGLASGFLAIGTATWDTGRDELQPAAPVLLRTCRLHPTGPAHDDFDLDLGVDAEFNPVLAHYLATVAGIPVDSDDLGRRAAVASGLDPYPVYAALQRLCAALPGFAVAPRLVVGTYPYGKYAMVADVVAAEPRLARHDLVAALAGDEVARERLRLTLSDPPSDPDPALDACVLDADPAQASVVDAALVGTNLAVTGPPGSGRTQTAANLVAAAAGAGKRILLVVPRRDVIASIVARLEAVGLGDIVLDTTAAAVDRGPVRTCLTAALDRAGRPDRSGGEALDAARTDSDVLDRLRTARGHLVDHVDALHEVRAPWGVSVHGIQWAMAELEKRPHPPSSHVSLDADRLRRLSRSRIDELARDLTHAAERGAWRAGAADDPWFRARFLTADEAERAREIVTRLSQGELSRATSRLDDILSDSSVPQGASLAAVGTALQTMHGVRNTLEVFRPDVFDRKLDEEVAATASHAWRRDHDVTMGWWRRWRGRRAARALLRPGRPPRDLHAELTSAQQQRDAWIGIAGGGGRPEISARLEEADVEYAALAGDLVWLGERVERTADGGDLVGLPVEQLQTRLERLAAHLDRLDVLPEVTPALDQVTEAGLGDVVEDLARRGVEPGHVAAEVEHVWWASLSREIADRDARFGRHDGSRLRRDTTYLRTLDIEHLAELAGRVRDGVDRRARSAVAIHPDVVSTLRTELDHGRRPVPLPDLLRSAAPVVGALHPCLAVSPHAVGQLIPAEARFDVVVVDDADRLTAADLVSALSRAGQVVALGDLSGPPPSPFAIATPDGIPEAVSSVPASESPPVPSVLHDLAEFLPTRQLHWRHATVDERLAGPETPAELDGDLLTVPGPVIASPVRFVPVDAVAQHPPPAEQAIESTDAEVAAVVDLVMDHARRTPDRSLAVVALSRRHAALVETAVRERIRAALRDGAELGRLDTDDRGEPFVVRPVQRAGGLVRDEVVLTVGYGRTPHGRVLYRFPDLDPPGSDRLLAAAAASARAALTVVSGLRADDLEPERVRTAGVRALREILQYAERESDATEGSEVVSLQDPLMSDLAGRLRREGFVVRERLGRNRHGIEIAVGHRRHPGRYLVAVESDGIGYAAVPGARARDRLRVEQLERMGWRHVRIWSTDLYRDPAREVARVVGAVRRALAEGEAPPARSAPPVEPDPAAGWAAGGSFDRSRDDTDEGWRREDQTAHEEWLRDQRPPHWE